LMLDAADPSVDIRCKGGAGRGLTLASEGSGFESRVGMAGEWDIRHCRDVDEDSVRGGNDADEDGEEGRSDVHEDATFMKTVCERVE